MSDRLIDRLKHFATSNRFSGTGALSVALVITDQARTLGLPIDPEKLISKRSGGQVVGLSSGAVQKILVKHGIDRILSREAGRTNRGSINNMRSYVSFLNELASDATVEFDAIEQFWVERVNAFFSGKPFRLKVDPSQGVRLVVRNLLEQARERQRTSTGTNYAGAVMQHLVGAKLECAIADSGIVHHSFSTSDQQTGRAGDFLIGETAVHVTTTPSDGLIRKCRENIESGLRPIVVTTHRGSEAVEQLADNVALASRIDVFEIEQFVALNVYELGRFAGAGNRTAIEEIVRRYNEIVMAVETDPSLRIED
jgi:hypothetical protein